MWCGAWLEFNTMVVFTVRGERISYGYVKGRQKFMVMFQEYRAGVDRLFVFECLGDVFKGGSYEVERGGLGLAGGGGICLKV